MSIPATTRSTRSAIAPTFLVLGCAALAARYALAALAPRPAAALALFFCGLLIVGAWLPVPRPAPPARVAPARPVGAATTAAVALVGIAAFVGGRVVVGGHAPFTVSGYAVVTSSVAAVAEEAWFRRLGYALLEPAGPVFAIGGTTLLFAMVHVAAYGWWVLPVDLAAGALLGWQRWASGSWTAPAVTHVIANLLVLL